MRKNNLRFLLSILTGCCFLMIFMGCSGGGSSSGSATPPATTTPDSLNTNGIRNDVQQYIDSVYPDSAKKKAALTQYAKSLQDAYTKITNESDAQNFEPQVIKSLACIRMIGETAGTDSPTRMIGAKTSNTPERLAAKIRYEQFLDGKVFTVSAPGDTASTVCDFDPNSLSN